MSRTEISNSLASVTARALVVVIGGVDNFLDFLDLSDTVAKEFGDEESIEAKGDTNVKLPKGSSSRASDGLLGCFALGLGAKLFTS